MGSFVLKQGETSLFESGKKSKNRLNLGILQEKEMILNNFKILTHLKPLCRFQKNYEQPLRNDLDKK